MTKTTLTREKLFKKAKVRYQVVDVPGFGKVGIRSGGEVQRSRRAARMWDGDGNPIEESFAQRRVHAIIDQVMVDEGTPMFSEKDAKDLGALDSNELDPLFAAITKFNEGEDTGKKGGLSDSSES